MLFASNIDNPEGVPDSNSYVIQQGKLFGYLWKGFYS